MRVSQSRRSFLGAMSAAASAVGLTERSTAAAGDEPLAILGGKPVRRQRFSRWPILGDNDEKAWMEVLRKRQVVPDRRRLRHPLRGDLGADDGGQALRRGRQRHERPDHVAGRARDRARRRGARPSVHVRRHDQRRPAPPRAAGLRGHGPGDLPDRCPPARIVDHRAHGLHPAGAHRRLGRRHGQRSWPSPPGTSCRSSRTPARRPWASGRAASSARSATWAASASRPRRT